MSRVNLLFVGRDAQLRAGALQGLSRVHREHFVFEAGNLEEAQRLLSKLRVNMVLVDLDQVPTDLVAMARQYPQVQLMGVSAHPQRLSLPIDPVAHRVFDRRELASALTTELKAQRKATASPLGFLSIFRSEPSAPAHEFRDFDKLARVSAN